MQTTEFIEKLAEIIERTPTGITVNSQLTDIGWDSMSVVGFIAFADAELETSVPASQLQACKTVADLITLLNGKVA